MPAPQGTDQIIVERYGFLRSLGLAVANDLLHDRSSNPELSILEVNVLPLKSE
jgi:hypothetical protein